MRHNRWAAWAALSGLLVVAAPAAAGMTLDMAAARSKATGLPMFVISGSDS